jgi:hypothetical protein
MYFEQSEQLQKVIDASSSANNKRIVSITAPKTNSECILVPTIRQKLLAWSHSWSRHKLASPNGKIYISIFAEKSPKRIN